MKKLIFIDNDIEKCALEDVDYVKDKLEHWANLPQEFVNTITITPNFHTLNPEDRMALLFNPGNCICTWSMYTANHYGSLYQMLYLLSAAARNEVKGIIYIDGSGCLPKKLSAELQETKNVFDVLNAIETNFIISFDEGEVFRLRVDLKGRYENPFRKEKVNLKELLC